MPATSVVNKPTSLKLPAALKAQLEDVAQAAGLSLHAFMIQTLADSVRRTRLRESFAQDSMAALHSMKASGLGYELCDVRAHFSQLSSYRKGQQPKPPDLLPSRLG
jgi:predicted transcriptional regulator